MAGKMSKRQEDVVKEETIIRATKDRKSWRTMIVHVPKGYNKERREKSSRLKKETGSCGEL